MSSDRAPYQWLEDARRTYLGTGDRKIEDLRRAIDDLEASPNSESARQALRILLHNLIGSGASYGYPGISVVARRLSSALKRATDGRTVVESGLIFLLRSGLAELKEHFDRERGL